MHRSVFVPTAVVTRTRRSVRLSNR
jgi:hypothetical protein